MSGWTPAQRAGLGREAERKQRMRDAGVDAADPAAREAWEAEFIRHGTCAYCGKDITLDTTAPEDSDLSMWRDDFDDDGCDSPDGEHHPTAEMTEAGAAAAAVPFEAIAAIVDYCWADEEADAAECEGMPDQENGIFPRLQAVRAWLDSTARTRLEYLRGEIQAERISWGEIAELQSLARFIEPGDTELLEWAGVPEHNDSDQEN